jgi:hypothetical protein
LINIALTRTQPVPADFPWIFGAFGIVALAVGIICVSRPRQSGEAWWRFTQATRPYPVPKVPLGIMIATGCLFVVIGLVMLSFGWVFLAH